MRTMIPMMMLQAKLAANKFLKDENGDVNVVAIVVLIGVAVVLALLLKDSLTNLINTLIESITQNAKSAVES